MFLWARSPESCVVPERGRAFFPLAGREGGIHLLLFLTTQSLPPTGIWIPIVCNLATFQ